MSNLVLKSDLMQKRQFPSIKLYFIITGAKAIRLVGLQKGAPVLTGFDAADLTTAKIDAFLAHDGGNPAGDIAGSTIYDATAMGTDAFGVVVNMQGQAQKAVAMKYKVVTTAGGTPGAVDGFVEASGSALPATLTDGIAVSAAGNLYCRLIAANIDAGTAGYVELELIYQSK
jgi:hypothetical protein